jgi:multidrug efflux pump subunit AcrA (membrane-fusion protein)
MRKPLLIVGAALLATGAGVGGWAYWRARQAPPPPVVETVEADLPEGAVLALEGSVRALHVVSVAAPLDGVLEEIPVAPGDEVFEGQILGRIANEVLEQNERNALLELERAQARLAGLESALLAARLEESRVSADAARARAEFQRAERDFERQRLLLREGATARNTHDASQRVFETSQTESETLTALSRAIQDRIQQSAREIEAARRVLAQEEEDLEAARLDLRAAQVMAPVDGLIIAIRKTAGSEVHREVDVLFDIGVDLTALEVVLEPEPPVLKRMQAGLPVLVELAELPGEGLPGAVRAVEDGKVYVEFASPSPLIRPGDTAVVRVQLP